jgi:hypothetical protein
MKTEEELRKLFYSYANGDIEVSYCETEPVMDVNAFIKLMKELNLCNKHSVSNNEAFSEVSVCPICGGRTHQVCYDCTEKLCKPFKGQTDC